MIFPVKRGHRIVKMSLAGKNNKRNKRHYLKRKRYNNYIAINVIWYILGNDVFFCE